MGQVLAARQDFLGGFALEREGGQFPRLGELEAADEELDRRHERRRGAQFVHPQNRNDLLTKLKDLRNYLEFLEKEKSDLSDRPTTIPRAGLLV